MADSLRRLEKFGLLERSEGTSVNLLYGGTHNWIFGGPMQKRYFVDETASFIQHVADKLGPERPDDFIATTSDRRVSEETLKDFVKTLDQTFRDFRRRVQTEESLLPSSKLVSVKWLACMSKYEPPQLTNVSSQTSD